MSGEHPVRGGEATNTAGADPEARCDELDDVVESNDARAQILKRRKIFIAAAMSGLAMAVACDSDEPQPQVCLSPQISDGGGGAGGAQVCLSQAFGGDNPGGQAQGGQAPGGQNQGGQGAAGGASAGGQDQGGAGGLGGGPQVCLSPPPPPMQGGGGAGGNSST